MSNYIYYNGELYHHGVKGMKWGRRKAKQEARDNYKSTIKKAKEDYKLAKQKAKEIGYTQEQLAAKADRKARVGKAAVKSLLTTGGIAAASLYGLYGNHKDSTPKVMGFLGLFGGVPITAIAGIANVATEALKK